LQEEKPVIVTATIANDFKIKPEQLEAAITKKTRLVIFKFSFKPDRNGL